MRVTVDCEPCDGRDNKLWTWFAGNFKKDSWEVLFNHIPMRMNTFKMPFILMAKGLITMILSWRNNYINEM